MKRAFGLIEVLVALVVLSVALLPILVMNSLSRSEVRDSETFFRLLQKAEQVPPAYEDLGWPLVRRTASVSDGPRRLVVSRTTVDPLGSIAPRKAR